MRQRVLKYFNADPNHFDVVFVANATAGIKLVMEGFRDHEGGFWYGYHQDSHTSLVGVREAAKAGQRCFMTDAEVTTWLEDGGETGSSNIGNDLLLFAYPAQSNMNGRRLPLSWPKRIRSCSHGEKIYSLLDAAALVSTSPFDLSVADAAPDFTVVSFYKVFGFPDLGALIVRKESAAPLTQRSYFGGGTVDMVTCGIQNWHIKKQGSLHEQLEDGTLPIHSIIALDNALNTHARLFTSIDCVSHHVTFLAQHLYEHLAALHHYNGQRVCKIYKDPFSTYTDSKTQGPIIAFNLSNSLGHFVSNTEIEKLAAIKHIQLRSGGLCNPGGIASSLGLTPWQLERNFTAGHRCGTENDIVEGRPVGMLRVSLGAMSNLKDVENLLDFLAEFFVDKADSSQVIDTLRSREVAFSVESLTIYPIKSCGGWPIPYGIGWDLREEGLAWDREWCVVHQAGTRQALSQKKYPKMALLRPTIDLDSGLLRVRFDGPQPLLTPLEITLPLNVDSTLSTANSQDCRPTASSVCGDLIQADTYLAKNIADFFTNTIGTPCTLVRFPSVAAGLSERHSKAHLRSVGNTQVERPILLSNESPVLTISRSSLNRLNEQIKAKDGKAANASVFRANIIIAEDHASRPGCEKPYIEDDWKSLMIGNAVRLDVLGPCRRCLMVCVDQSTAEKDEEPFVTLAKTRRKEGKVYFGVHTALSSGQKHPKKIKVGDRVLPCRTDQESGVSG